MSFVEVFCFLSFLTKVKGYACFLIFIVLVKENVHYYLIVYVKMASGIK